jgi:hypothetical protein
LTNWNALWPQAKGCGRGGLSLTLIEGESLKSIIWTLFWTSGEIRTLNVAQKTHDESLELVATTWSFAAHALKRTERQEDLAPKGS